MPDGQPAPALLISPTSFPSGPSSTADYVILLLIPAGSAQFVENPLLSNLLQLVALLVILSVGFLAWPRLRRWYGGLRRSRASRASSARNDAGREFDLVLGNTRPWMFVVPQSMR